MKLLKDCPNSGLRHVDLGTEADAALHTRLAMRHEFTKVRHTVLVWQTRFALSLTCCANPRLP